MTDNVIEVSGLKKSFRKYEREAGAWSALKSVFKRKYKTIKAVKGVNFNVKQGEILGYIGPNGAGKSTVIKMLTGVLHPDEGMVKALGYNPWKEREDYVANIGVIFGHKSVLWWDLPPMDSYRLYKEIYQIPDKGFNKRLDFLVEMLRVKDLIKTPVRKLSLGERMKCEFIASVLHKPKILFLDEPTIGLDIVAKERIRKFIKRVNREFGTTIILTTHDISDVEELCDRIIIIDKGSHVYQGSLVELKKKYMQEKKITVEFGERPGRISFRYCRINKLSSLKADIFVNIRKAKARDIVDRLLKHYDITDINISDETVESIIRKIYLEQAGVKLGP